MKLYAITDRRLYPGTERERCEALLRQAALWIRAGVDFVQLREKDLSRAALADLIRGLCRVRDQESGRASQGKPRTRTLVNCANPFAPGAIESIASAGADGIHLTGAQAFDTLEATWPERLARVPLNWQGSSQPIVSVACHSLEETRTMRDAEPSMVLFAPVFAKQIDPDGGRVLPGTGVKTLFAFCKAASPVPTFALGGVTAGNALQCTESGAAGVAGIRLFAGDGWRELVEL